MCNHATVKKEINPYLITRKKLQNILVRANASYRLKNMENIWSTRQYINLLFERFPAQEELGGKSVSCCGNSKADLPTTHFWYQESIIGTSYPFLTPGIHNRNFLAGTFRLKGAVSRRGSAWHCLVLLIIWTVVIACYLTFSPVSTPFPSISLHGSWRKALHCIPCLLGQHLSNSQSLSQLTPACHIHISLLPKSL